MISLCTSAAKYGAFASVMVAIFASSDSRSVCTSELSGASYVIPLSRTGIDLNLPFWSSFSLSTRMLNIWISSGKKGILGPISAVLRTKSYAFAVFITSRCSDIVLPFVVIPCSIASRLSILVNVFPSSAANVYATSTLKKSSMDFLMVADSGFALSISSFFSSIVFGFSFIIMKYKVSPYTLQMSKCYVYILLL